MPFCDNCHSKYVVHHSLLPQESLQIHCPSLPSATRVTPNTSSICHKSHSKYIVHHSLLPQQSHCPSLPSVTVTSSITSFCHSSHSKHIVHHSLVAWWGYLCTMYLEWLYCNKTIINMFVPHLHTIEAKVCLSIPFVISYWHLTSSTVMVSDFAIKITKELTLSFLQCTTQYNR